MPWPLSDIRSPQIAAWPLCYHIRANNAEELSQLTTHSKSSWDEIKIAPLGTGAEQSEDPKCLFYAYVQLVKITNKKLKKSKPHQETIVQDRYLNSSLPNIFRSTEHASSPHTQARENPEHFKPLHHYDQSIHPRRPGVSAITPLPLSRSALSGVRLLRIDIDCSWIPRLPCGDAAPQMELPQLEIGKGPLNRKRRVIH